MLRPPVLVGEPRLKSPPSSGASTFFISGAALLTDLHTSRRKSSTGNEPNVYCRFPR